MKLTNDQALRLISELELHMRPIYLRCDGELLHTSSTRIGENRTRVAVHISGHCDGDFQECAKKVSSLSARTRKFCAVKQQANGDIYAHNLWSSGRALINHLGRHCKQIEILDHATHARLVEQYKEPENA